MNNNINTIAIIVTYNRLSLLQECLSNIDKGREKSDILLIDNNSDDGTYDYINKFSKVKDENIDTDIKELIKNVEVLNDITIYKFSNDITLFYKRLKENTGGAGGYNIGTRIACYLPYKYMWYMDDDTMVNAGTLYNLKRADRELTGDYAFLSSKVLWIDNNICKTNVQRLSVARKIRDFKTSLVEVDYSSFVSFFVKKDDALRVGLPIKDFFIWSDDLEYTRRFTLKKFDGVRKPGYLVNDSFVIHKTAQNTGVDITREIPARIDRYKHIYRNDVFTFRKEGIRGYLFLFFRFLFHIFKILIRADKKISKIKTIVNGYVEGFSFNPDIEYLSREDIKNIRNMMIEREAKFKKEENKYNNEVIDDDNFEKSEDKIVYDENYKDKRKILIMFGEPITYGGQESVIYNILSSIHIKKYHIDLFTPYYADNKKLIELINKNGGEVFALNKPFKLNDNRFLLKPSIDSFLKTKENVYDVAHINTGSLSTMCVEAMSAKLASINRVIIHSHTVNIKVNPMHIIKVHILSAILKIYADYFVACSKESAKSKWTNDIIKKSYIVYNGIDVDKFKYSEYKRKQIRDKYDIDKYFVIGHVGRMTYEKNHKYLVRVFEEVCKYKNYIRLMMIGSGPLSDDIKLIVDNKKLTEKVIFVESTDEIDKYYSAFDMYVFPSIYEGMPVSPIEAETSGLPTLMSDRITKETYISNMAAFIPLKDISMWSDLILSVIENKHDEFNREHAVIDFEKFDRRKTFKIIEELYN